MMPTTFNGNDDRQQIIAIINHYFDGLHRGDAALLGRIFHPDVCLKAPSVRRSMTEWLNDVSERKSPEQLSLAFNFKIESLDIVKDQAMAKIHCPLFSFDYIDFLGLLKEDGQWRIVSKMYTDVSVEIQRP
ncbi:nuclear transport factor 2 family protein [Vibrio fluvialis]|jgi:4-oxalocrotonate tautomerase|uniref:nuclear transport factor 2 family protein n=2 Tax=Vibrio fluvialis TaxID=676 RepID=UPI001F3E974A|nr:nuclear transport factor 2 family protein [Vibrio fluvialis]MCE7649625.1 nuclear transport factor 2 family protein [Vibrio fluvialis]